MRRHNLQIAASRLTITPARQVLPICFRISLERGLSSCRALRSIEEKTAGLSPGFSIDFEDVIVFPTDSNASRHTHYSGSAIGSTLLSARLVFGGIPSVSHLTSLSRNRNGFVISFFRGDHTDAPVFSDERHPCSCQIDRSHRFGSRGRTTGPPRTTLCVAGRRHD